MMSTKIQWSYIHTDSKAFAIRAEQRLAALKLLFKSRLEEMSGLCFTLSQLDCQRLLLTADCYTLSRLLCIFGLSRLQHNLQTPLPLTPPAMIKYSQSVIHCCLVQN